nr:MFS transporter [Sphingomonas sp. BT552]
MTAVYCFAFVDRQILNLLVGPIKREFAASDSQIGYLLGPAFIFSYASLGLPAGWWVDRTNRRNLVFGAGIVWGLGTMAAAFVTSYEALFLSRLVVGGSEAFLFPAGMSMIADMFDKRRLPVATSVFLASPYIGGGLALIFGGLVLQWTESLPQVALPLIGGIPGWQFTFIIIGLVGLLPVLLLPTIHEPARDRHDADEAAADTRRYGFVQGLAYMAQRWRYYFAFFFGAACSSLVLTTVSAWAPTFLTRSFGMNPAAIGVNYGSLVLVFGLGGGLLSPIVNAFIARRHPLDSTMRTVRLGPVMVMLSALCLWFSTSQTMALVCLACLTFAYSFPLSMAGTSLQLATPPRLRGSASAAYFVIVSLIGHGVGPTLVPLVTHNIFGDEARVGEALALIAFVFGVLAFCLLSFALRGFQIERGLREHPAVPKEF